MNRKTLSLTLFPVFFFALVLSAQLVLAQQNSNCTTETLSNGQVKKNCTFTNPITEQKSFGDLLSSVVKQLRPLAITVITILIIWNGFLYVYYASQGQSGQGGLTNLKKNIPRLILGIALIAGAEVIINAVKIFSEGIK